MAHDPRKVVNIRWFLKPHNHRKIKQEEEPIGIPYPPDYVFKYNRNRIAPEQNIWGNGTVMYVPTHAEYVDGKGIFIHYRGTDIPPSRCIAPVQAIAAVDSVKRLLIQALGFLSEQKAILIPAGILAGISKKFRKKLLTDACDRLNRIGDVTLYPFYLEDGYYAAPVKEIQFSVAKLLCELGVPSGVSFKTGEIIGCMFEFDNAYRWRVQDIMDECDPEALYANLPKELNRLIAIMASREVTSTSDVPGKFKKGITILSLAWKIPVFRKALREAIKGIRFEDIQMNEMDIYHTYLWGSYQVGGRSIADNLKILSEIHGEDQTKWPPRIIVR